MTTMNSVVQDFSNMLGEAEALLKLAGSQTGEQARALQTEVEAKLLHAKLRLEELESKAAESAVAVKEATENYVVKNPWQAIGLAAAVGFLAGVVIARR